MIPACGVTVAQLGIHVRVVSVYFYTNLGDTLSGMFRILATPIRQGLMAMSREPGGGSGISGSELLTE